MKYLLPFTLLAAVLLTGCKYEDGPLVSIRSAKNRVFGSKKVEAYIVNGIDSTFLFDSLYAGTEYMTNKESGIFFDLHDANYNLTISDCAPGIWGFHDSKAYYLYLSFPGCNGREFWRRQEWRVTRLTQKDLWLESERPNEQASLRFRSN